MGSEGSSPDEKCANCEHFRVNHHKQGGCVICAVGFTARHCITFAPADAESAEPECSACGGNDPETCPFCARRAEEEPEPEAPECSHESWEVTGERRTPEGWLKWRKCADCREPLDNLIEAQPHYDQPEEPKAESARRPPYAVAYALASGELYEVALPGDAVATVEHGVLKISHPQGVAHIIQVKPMGEQ